MKVSIIKHNIITASDLPCNFKHHMANRGCLHSLRENKCYQDDRNILGLLSYRNEVQLNQSL